MPAVSVILPAYNHERFVGECLQSVLDQTFQDFEIVIADDGSTDGTAEIIRSFRDRRIRFHRFPENRGACVAANHCLTRARGKYIAMLSSDDAWYPEKLAVQVRYLDAHPKIGAVFGKVDWIDEDGGPLLPGEFPFLDIFEVKNRSRQKWLRRFLENGNCLCHPCSLVRREVYRKVGGFDPSLASLPDFDLWIRVCLRYDIHVLDRRLIRFRRMRAEANASGDTAVNRIRNRFEFRRVLDHYLQVDDPADLLMIYPEARRYGTPTPKTIPYFLARCLMEKGWEFMTLWALDAIYGVISDAAAARELETHAGFTHRDFIRLTGEHDVFRIYTIFPDMRPVHPASLVPDRRGTIRKILSASKRYLLEVGSLLRAAFRR